MNFPIFFCSAASVFLLASAKSTGMRQDETNQLNLNRLEAALEKPQNSPIQIKQGDFTDEDLELIDSIYNDLQTSRDKDFSPIGKRSLSLFGDRDRRLLSALELREMINTYKQLRQSLEQDDQST